MSRFNKLYKTGNTLALSISKEIANEIGFAFGDYVKVEVVDGKMVVSKVEA